MIFKSILLALTLLIHPILASGEAEYEEAIVVAASSKKRKHEAKSVKNEHITTMDLSNERELTNIDFLVYFPNLERLNLKESFFIKDSYHIVSGLEKLKYLHAACCNITTLIPLRSLTTLVSLNLRGNLIESIEAIVHLPKLRRLNIYGCSKIKDLETLNNLTSLTNLNMGCTLREDDVDYPSTLDFLTSLVNLRKLDLSSNLYLFQIRPLILLTQLDSLDLHSNFEITDWNELSKFISLKKLSVEKEIKLPRLPSSVEIERY